MTKRTTSRSHHEVFGDRIHVGNTDFAEAITLLRAMPGARAEREGWPLVELDDGSYAGPRLVWVPGSTITVTADRPLGAALPWLVGEQVRYLDHVDRVDHQGAVGPWTPSPDDLVAVDWSVSWPAGTEPRRPGALDPGPEVTDSHRSGPTRPPGASRL